MLIKLLLVIGDEMCRVRFERIEVKFYLFGKRTGLSCDEIRDNLQPLNGSGILSATSHISKLNYQPDFELNVDDIRVRIDRNLTDLYALLWG